MKKLFSIFVVFIGFGFITNAQDVILKKDGSEIIAKVLEITEQQVKYKDFDFQSGPIRNINISEVFMITYENGKKEVFNKETAAPATQDNPDDIYLNDLKSEFDRIGTNDSEMLNFFKRNNFTKYSNSFESACKMRDSGRKLLGAGIGLTAGGLVWVILGVTISYDLFWMSFVGYGLMAVGEVLTIVSIPISAVAGSKKRAIKNDFAREYFGLDNYTYQPTLNFGYTGNGFGICLKF